MSDAHYNVADLLYLMSRLRDPEHGCPWDCSQDYRSIVSHTLEECYELVDTIERGDFEHLQEELGDLLFQVIFYSRLAEEDGHFDFYQVTASLVRKLVRRHPHVFPDGQLRQIALDVAPDTERLRLRWDDIKRQERGDKARHGLLADIPLALPALNRARKLQARAARVGFDWPDTGGVVASIQQELDELRREIEDDHPSGMEQELGDLLFSVVNLARHLSVDPETALRRANHKFQRRFEHMEVAAQGQGQDLASLDASALDRLWRLAKLDDPGQAEPC